MARVGEELAGRALLHKAAGVEDPDALAHPRDDAQVVADEEDRGVEALAQLLDQVEHLGLDGRVEPGRRLVEHEQVGVVASAIANITRCCWPPESSCG